jgi:hypothetical protein
VSVAADLLASVERACAGRTVPRVRTLHLPPPSAQASKDGEFCALELDGGAIGLSYVLLDDTLDALRNGPSLCGADALEVARWVADGRGSRRTIGFAALNALSRHVFDAIGFMPPDAPDSIGGIDPHRGERIGMVGLFPPLIKAIVARGADLTVLELRADLAGDHVGWHVTLDPSGLAGCRQVLCTSTVLLNETLDGVLAACRDAQRVVLVGPGAGCLPDVLFARGVTALAGAWIDDGPALCDALRRGQPWGRHTRKFLLERSDWTGPAPAQPLA